MQRCWLRTTVRDGRTNQNVVRRGLSVFDLNVEEAIFREYAGVPNLKLAFHFQAGAASCDQFFVRKTCLRIAVQHRRVTVRRRRISVPVELLYIFAVVPLRSGDAEQPLLQNRIALIPKGERETKPPFLIGNSTDTVFVPTVRTRTRMLVWKIIPRVAVRAVVLSHCSPGALGQIRSPEMPRLFGRFVFGQTLLLGIHAHESSART